MMDDLISILRQGNANVRLEVSGTDLLAFSNELINRAKSEFPHVREFFTHIFGEQIELGYDYLQLLYLRPQQRLPILLLVSQERNTGKTTFLNFLKMIFEGNVTFNTNEDFRSQFNDD